MRNWFIIVALAAFATGLAAQVSPGLDIITVVHEPNTNDVGPYIAGLQIPNPFYDPLQPNGQPQYNNVYGNGKGLSNELDSISPEFYALGATTTHDLAILQNTTGAAITIDATTIQLAGERPKNDNPDAPEQSSPDGSAVHVIYPYDQVSITIPDGNAVALFLITSGWRDQLDTSPREYIWTFTFSDMSGTPFTVEAPLVVPKVGGDVGSGGCASDPDGYPEGLWILATGGIAAIVIRRKLLEKARA
ncbi:MAG: hypothetical protein H6839_11970 [Planctomycetes bacterium]|nr:hypothetical protein [Planctomycetota bacterium]